MRKYTEKFVTRRLFTSRINNAACPFPGKYPLRILVKTAATLGMMWVPLYHGKFTSAVWRRFFNDPPSMLQYSIYDKAGAVLWGTTVQYGNVPQPQVLYRYFGTTMLDGHWLTKLEIKTFGPYQAYMHRSLPVNQASYVSYVSRNVPHIRTV